MPVFWGGHDSARRAGTLTPAESLWTERIRHEPLMDVEDVSFGTSSANCGFGMRRESAIRNQDRLLREQRHSSLRFGVRLYLQGFVRIS